MSTKAQIETVWENAKKIRGKDPDTFRQDQHGNVMCRNSYGIDYYANRSK